MATITSYKVAGRRSGLLLGISSICIIVGVLLLVAGALLLSLAVYAFVSPSQALQLASGPGGMLLLLWSAGLLIGGLQFLAAGAIFRLMIQLEENTRATAQLLDEARARAHAGTESIFRS
jgi:hypothetical protein